MPKLSLIGLAAGLTLLSAAANSAQAHFKLLKPTSWVNEDDVGEPQKSPPCGAPSDATAPKSGAVTTFRAGETITVEWQATIAHPGYFRIALAENRADLKDPT